MRKRSQAQVEDVADRIHSAAIHLLRRARSVDDETGLSPSRLSALSVIVFAGPLSLRALAEAEQVTAPTMTRLVQGLENDGLLRKKSDPEDARAVRIEATAAGRRVLETGRARRIDRIASLLASMTARELSTLLRSARLIEDAVASGSAKEGEK